MDIRVLGLMSGSSLDGLDLAYCHFTIDQQQQNQPLLAWHIHSYATKAYSPIWQQRLAEAPQLDGRSLWQLHADFGHFMGQVAAEFLQSKQLEADLIGSHGHTVFHHPDRQMTTQIGDGAAIAAQSGLPTVTELRSMDIAQGGQGAPLAPLADRYCFGEYDFCLNLGGIANISAKTPQGYLAFDIGYANQILNRLAQQLGKPMDSGGAIARRGKLLVPFMHKLDELPYWQQTYPKSLDNAWVRDQVWPIFEAEEAATADLLRTACEHIARQIADHLHRLIRRENMPVRSYRMLVSGGGAYNDFLIECIQSACNDWLPIQLIIPEAAIIEAKEAMFIGLAAALRYVGLPNSIASVTGASRDCVNGALYAGEKGSGFRGQESGVRGEIRQIK